MSQTNLPPPLALLVSGHQAASRNQISSIRAISTLFTLISLLLLAVPVSAVYTPTSLLYHRADDNESTHHNAYLFLPDDGGVVGLYGLNVTTELDAGAISSSWSSLSTSLPFVNDRSPTSSFSPSIADDGTLYAFAGDCSSTTSELWVFQLDDNDGNDESGIWKKIQSFDSTGPSFLGSSAAFSTTLDPEMSNPALYSWGGMCPTKNATVDSWLTEATYTTAMTKVGTHGNGDDYSASVLKSRGPVAEAGFTFTVLSPITATISETTIQQVNVVVLGGHTAAAFVNMSTAAVWSLPEESWGFVYIDGPPSTSNGELALRTELKEEHKRSDTPTSIDPRSGHTAVLSEDGSTLVVYGGWVGDISQTAQPQLAILNVGAGYGGTSGWSWEIPDSQPNGAGIYGHGAALLPGNVMMVYGGYNISVAPDATSKRASEPTLNSKAQFFNLTSRSWSPTYTNPDYNTLDTSSDVGDADDDGPDVEEPETETAAESSNLKKLGLGLGLGLGFAAILIAIAFFFCYRRRLRTQKGKRDATVRSLAQDHRQFLQSNDDEFMDPMAEKSRGFFPWSNNGGGWYTGGGDAYANGSRSLGYETLRNSGRQGSTWASNSAPTLGYPAPPVARKPAARVARGHYVPASSTGDFMGSPGSARLNSSGPIHPIYEADEDREEKEFRKEVGAKNSETSLSGPSTPTNKRLSDPFATPTRATMNIPPPVATVGSRAQPSDHSNNTNVSRRDPDVQDWAVDVDEAENLLNRMASQKGRASPTRRPSVREPTAEEDTRTTSNLSDRSAATVASVSSRFRMFGLGASNNNNNNNAAIPGSNQKGKGKDMGEEARAGSSDSSDKSFSTARSSFPGLQAEGPALLYGSKASSHPNNVNATTAIITGDVPDENDYIPGSPSKMKPRPGWLGSLRRVFSTSGAHGNRGAQPSPTGSNGTDKTDWRKSMSSEYGPPRMVGLNPALLRRKQGKHAWRGEDDGLEYTAVPEGESSSQNIHRHAEDSDWDIERAVEQRLVQVMFTVPRERLRVVNAEIEKEEEVVLVDATQIEDSENSSEDRRSGESINPLGIVAAVETPRDTGTTSARAITTSGIRKASKTSSRKPSESLRKVSGSSKSRRRGGDSPLDVEIAVSDSDVGVQIEIIQETPSPSMASSNVLGASTPSRHHDHAHRRKREDSDPFTSPKHAQRHKRKDSDPFASPDDAASATDEVESRREELDREVLNMPPIRMRAPTLELPSTNTSHLAPGGAIERNPSPAISLGPPTPVRLAQDLDRAGFFAGDREMGFSHEVGDGLTVPDQHHDDTASERTDFSVSSAGGARTAEMVWFERVQRMDRRERSRGTEAVEERVDRISREAESVAADREKMFQLELNLDLELEGGLLGPSGLQGASALSEGGEEREIQVLEPTPPASRTPGTPSDSPRRRTRVLEMVDSFESLRREVAGGATTGSPSAVSGRTPNK